MKKPSKKSFTKESMDIRKHRFVPSISTSSKAMKSMKDKEREHERRDWKQKLRNGDYEDYDDYDEWRDEEDSEQFDESGTYERCPSCHEMIHLADGESEIECPNCGEMVEFYTDEPTYIQCPHCGEDVDEKESGSFCPSCGKSIYLDDDDDDSSSDGEDTYKFTVTDIEWDTDDEDVSKLHLPETLVVNVPMMYIDNGSDAVEDYISDFLTDTYGYCHKGFNVEGLEDEEGQEFDESTPDGYEYKVSDIQWDVDDEADLDELPDTLIVTVPEEVCAVDEEEDWISDYLSDTYGFCHMGFVFDPVGEFDESITDDKKVETLSWEDFWGGDAEYDIAQDCEDIYEKGHGVSAVYWTDLNGQGQKTPSDSLVDRPDEYATHGYTGDFEDWGIRMTMWAISCGKTDPESIIKFIDDNGDVKPILKENTESEIDWEGKYVELYTTVTKLLSLYDEEFELGDYHIDDANADSDTLAEYKAVVNEIVELKKKIEDM